MSHDSWWRKTECMQGKPGEMGHQMSRFTKLVRRALVIKIAGSRNCRFVLVVSSFMKCISRCFICKHYHFATICSVLFWRTKWYSKREKWDRLGEVGQNVGRSKTDEAILTFCQNSAMQSSGRYWCATAEARHRQAGRLTSRMASKRSIRHRKGWQLGKQVILPYIIQKIYKILLREPWPRETRQWCLGYVGWPSSGLMMQIRT